MKQVVAELMLGIVAIVLVTLIGFALVHVDMFSFFRDYFDKGIPKY